jgi:hypothetical protein
MIDRTDREAGQLHAFTTFDQHYTEATLSQSENQTAIDILEATASYVATRMPQTFLDPHAMLSRFGSTCISLKSEDIRL